MKGVLIGADLLFRPDGTLVPIEINTNVAWDNNNRLESDLDDIFDLTKFKAFLNEHNLTEVWVEGPMATRLVNMFRSELNIKQITAEELEEDQEGVLLLRTSYSDEALVDAFCRDKIAFLDSLQGTDIQSEYILKTEGNLVGDIVAIPDYGEHIPNFIVKYRYPYYDKSTYPQLCRFISLDQLHDFVEDELPENYFIMPFYFNSDELWREGGEERIKFIRHFSVFVENEGALEAVPLGQYTKICGNLLGVEPEYSELGILTSGREAFLPIFDNLCAAGEVLAEKGDEVYMANGTWKAVEDLQEGEIVTAIDLPDLSTVLSSQVNRYSASLEDIQENSQFVTTSVRNACQVAQVISKVGLQFTDGTDWWDTDESSYLAVNSETGMVQFQDLANLQVGDEILLVQAGSLGEGMPVFEKKEIAAITTSRVVVPGYQISVGYPHLLLTREEGNADAYVSLEHNYNIPCQTSSHANANFDKCINATKLSYSSSAGTGTTSSLQTKVYYGTGSGHTSSYSTIQIQDCHGEIYEWKGYFGQMYSPTEFNMHWAAFEPTSGPCLSQSFHLNISFEGFLPALKVKWRVMGGEWPEQSVTYGEVGGPDPLGAFSATYTGSRPGVWYPSAIEFPNIVYTPGGYPSSSWNR